MRFVKFSLHICGMCMSKGNFSEKISIYNPSESFEKLYAVEQSDFEYVRDVVNAIKNDAAEFMRFWGNDDLPYPSMYINTGDELLGLQSDKSLAYLFEYFKTNELSLVHFHIAGGASQNNCGYRFTVHSDEDIHKNLPHVHVYKDDMNVRYSLKTLEHFPQDKLPRDFKRDEKKIIIPFLIENKNQLMGYWNHAMNGFITPALDEEGNQFYPES